jgi:hypothetical protein
MKRNPDSIGRIHGSSSSFVKCESNMGASSAVCRSSVWFLSKPNPSASCCGVLYFWELKWDL